MLAALGLFVFSLKTAPFQQLSRDTRQRWAANNRIGQRPALQHMGPGEDTITLSGVLAPEITGGPASLDVLRLMADSGKAWTLLDGKGFFYGLWGIDGISETRTLFFANGTARRIEFSLSLKRIGEGELEHLGDLARFAVLAAGGSILAAAQ